MVGHPSPVLPRPKDLKLSRLWRIDHNLLASHWMLKAQVEGREEESLPPEELVATRVDFVPEDGMVHLRHVSAKLMSPTRHRLEIDGREPVHVEATRLLHRPPARQTRLAIQR